MARATFSVRRYQRGAPEGAVLLTLCFGMASACGKSNSSDRDNGTTGGTGGSATGGSMSGGKSGAGGSATGGKSGTGGSATGGKSGTGGSATGGKSDAGGKGAGGESAVGGSDPAGAAGDAGEGGGGIPAGGSGGGSGGSGGGALCLADGGSLVLTTRQAIALDIDVSDDRYCTGTSLFDDPTMLRWTIPQGGNGLPVLVAVSVPGLSPGALLDDVDITYQIVQSGAGGTVWSTTSACTIDIRVNATVSNQPGVRRVGGSVSCMDAIPGSDPEGSLLVVTSHDFETAVALGP